MDQNSFALSKSIQPHGLDIMNRKLRVKSSLCVKESQCEKSQSEREIPQCEILSVCKSKCENSYLVHLKEKQNLSVNV